MTLSSSLNILSQNWSPAAGYAIFYPVMPRAINGYKICSRKACQHKGKPQPIENFSQNRRDRPSPDGHRYECKDCEKKGKKARRQGARYTAKERRRHLRRFYDLDEEDWNDIMEKQGYACGCCGEPFRYDPSGKMDSPVVHHNHARGEIIGIWHHGCNTAEGYIRTAKRAAALAKHMTEEELFAFEFNSD
jgi:hypothetical protein